MWQYMPKFGDQITILILWTLGSSYKISGHVPKGPILSNS